jgi:hypothetical protein
MFPGPGNIAVARGEPLDDEPVERTVERVVDELLELGPVCLDRGGDAPLDVDDGRPGHGRILARRRRRREAGRAALVRQTSRIASRRR